MLDQVLAVIRDRGTISEASLESHFERWSSTTLDSIVESAIEAGLITRGRGGGGGVLSLTSLADESPSEQDEDALIAQLEKRSKENVSVRKSELSGLLGWSQAKVNSVYATLYGQERILAKRGGWLVLAADEEEPHAVAPTTPAALPTQPAPTALPAVDPTPAAQPAVAQPTPTAPPAALSVASTSDNTWEVLSQDDLNRLASELMQGPTTNGRIRAALGWSPQYFWRIRTALVLKGRVVAEFGDGNTLRLRNDGDNFGSSELETLSAAALRFACKWQDDEFDVKVLSTQLGQGDEKAVCVCQNLLAREFVKPLRGGKLLLSPLITQPVTASAGTLDILRALDKTTLIAKNVLFSKLPGWTEEAFNQAVSDCCKADLIQMNAEVGIITVQAAAQQYVRDHQDEVGGSICLSPADFNDLQKQLQHDDVVMFVGAGASAGKPEDRLLPNWGTLLSRVFTYCQGASLAHRGEIESLLKTDLLSAASAIEETMGADFNAEISRILDRNRCGYPSTPLLLALSAIAVRNGGKSRVVVTTNLDELIDHTLGRPASQGLRSQPTNNVIHHIHGTLADPTSWVMTREQYNNRYHNTTEYYDALNGLFTGRVLMFVGYGMEDYEINLILDRMEGTYTRGREPRHFFFMEATEATKRPYFISRLKKLGMRPIYFRGYQNLPFLLLKLSAD